MSNSTLSKLREDMRMDYQREWLHSRGGVIASDVAASSAINNTNNNTPVTYGTTYHKSQNLKAGTLRTFLSPINIAKEKVINNA